jgi:putative transposase
LPGKSLIFHSDRGSQYASGRYAELLAAHGIKASMSRKGNCWDNACSETLFGSLKVERLHGMAFKDHREAKDATLDWMLWYNRSRLHSTLGYLSPAPFEQQANVQQIDLAASPRKVQPQPDRKHKTSTTMSDAL